MLDRCRRQNTVAEVEDVPRSTAHTLQDVIGLAEHAVCGAEQERRIEIALDRRFEADALPGGIDRDPPIDADHRTTGRAEFLQERRCAGAEVDRRDAVSESMKNPLCM